MSRLGRSLLLPIRTVAVTPAAVSLPDFIAAKAEGLLKRALAALAALKMAANKRPD
jgi:hypothetical protein